MYPAFFSAQKKRLYFLFSMILAALLFTSVSANILYWFGDQLLALNYEDNIIYVVFVISGYIATFFTPQLAMNKSLLYSV